MRKKRSWHWAVAAAFAACSAVFAENVLAQQTCQVPDPLDCALVRAGLSRSTLGISPRAWWVNYPRNVPHKLDLFDDLLARPVDIVPFARTLAKVVNEDLSPEALSAAAKPGWGPPLEGWRSVSDLVRMVKGLRSSATQAFPNLRAEEIPIDKAIIALYRAMREPTKFHMGPLPAGGPLVVQPDLEAELARRAASLPPAVSGILGKLVVNAADAHRWATLAFRNVTMEERLQVSRRLDPAQDIYVASGLDYEHVYQFDDVARKWDEASLWYAAIKATQALDDARHALEALPPDVLRRAQSFDWKTPLGWVRVRGTESDTIDATDAMIVVDLGGKDRWSGSVGASSPTQLVSLALDLTGDDTYEGDGYTQGAGIAGIGILLDAKGNDRYEAGHYAQGVGQLGFGALIDLQGDDTRHAGYVAQGAGTFLGVGLLIDAAGNDVNEILADGQGYGGPGSVGILADRSGDDVYRAASDVRQNGRRLYGSETNASSNAQGFATGKAAGYASGHSWAGGLGALIDISGKDQYSAGSWSQGAGYWFGTGLLYDGSGNDRYSTEGLFTQAAGAHYGVGALIDDGGNDSHAVRGSSGLAFGHDLSVALFVDTGGDDEYTLTPLDKKSTDVFGLGSSVTRSIALFIEEGGNDSYHWPQESKALGFAASANRYLAAEDGTGAVTKFGSEPDPAEGLNWLPPYFAYTESTGLFLDAGGKDFYSGRSLDDRSWGDSADSLNGRVHNMGIGMDVPGGRVDWRPIAR